MKTPIIRTSIANRLAKKTKRRPAKNESCLQRAIVSWCRGIGAGIVRDRFAAIPNGWHVRGASAIQSAIQCNKLKAEGMRVGIPDLIFTGPGGSVLWLEVKLGTAGRVSDAQKAVHESLISDGHAVRVVRDLTEAINEVRDFYGRVKP